MKPESRAIGWKLIAVIVAILVLVGASGYVLWAYDQGQPPFCSGYPPGGNCPGNFTFTFRVAINYSGPWKAAYYGYHSVGAPPIPFAGSGNYTGGNFEGTGPGGKNITLSGPNTNGVTLCVQALKLDSSSSLMALGFVPLMSNTTSVPYGKASLCVSAVP